MFRTVWMDLPPSFLTQISCLKMALWHWRVSQAVENTQNQTCSKEYDTQCWTCLIFSPLHPVGRLSEECEYFAYGLSSSGSDWVTIRFMKADDLTELPDILERVKFSCLAWTHDAKGIFYNRYPLQEGKTDGEGELKHQSRSKYVQECISSVFLNRHRDHLQHQSEALLPCHWHQAVRRHSGGRVPWASKVAQFCDREYTVVLNHSCEL